MDIISELPQVLSMLSLSVTGLIEVNDLIMLDSQ